MVNKNDPSLKSVPAKHHVNLGTESDMTLTQAGGERPTGDYTTKTDMALPQHGGEQC